MSLARLIYVSTAADTPGGETIGSILQSARLRNSSEGITGFLMLADRHFMQLLEGPEEAVNRVFESIRHDPRHRDVVIIHTCTEPARQFPNWTMGFADKDVHESQPDGEDLETVSLDEALPNTVDEDVRRLFVSFRNADSLVIAGEKALLSN